MTLLNYKLSDDWTDIIKAVTHRETCADMSDGATPTNTLFMVTMNTNTYLYICLNWKRSHGDTKKQHVSLKIILMSQHGRKKDLKQIQLTM